MLDPDSSVAEALAGAWHFQSAQASLERWFEVCAKEGWGHVPDNLPLLIKVFGASWYFTRYIFYRGKEAAILLDNVQPQDFQTGTILQKFAPIKQIDKQEIKLERLRLLKNEIMLQILASHLQEDPDQAKVEQALTHLANASLSVVLDIFGLKSRPGSRLAVYGMGRMAGDEMIFGSDLDLIFLFESDSKEVGYELSRKIRLLMRHIASPGSAGALYDVDMRLRPHGTSGALLTPASSFLEYHQSECEIWERQMMTRCKAVIDVDGLGSEYLEKILPYIYADYDKEYLRREIISMRKRVEDEKANVSGKHEVKRGPGGIMDIDFLTHFLQLFHAGNCPELRTCSSRTALRVLGEKNIIPAQTSKKLLNAYDFLKRIEASIRLFDMKPISAFPAQTADHLPVAAAMGYVGDNAGQFLEEYMDVTNYVRKEFKKLVGDPS